MPDTETTSPFDRAQEIAPSCAITPELIEQQKERHRRLRPSTIDIVRQAHAMVITFDETLERQTLDDLIAVENDCCPFLTFEFEEAAHRLRVGVNDPQHSPALDAMTEALGGRTSPA